MKLIPKFIAFLIGISPIFFIAFPSLVISSTDPVSEELKQRIQGVLKSKRLIGVVGKITDFKLDAITLVNSIDSYHVSVATNSAILKENKSVKISDLAISDRLIVIGYMGDNNVLESRRIIVTKEQLLIQKKFETITLTKIDKKTNTINSITVPTKMAFEYDKIKIGDKLAIITTTNGKITTLLKYLKL
jgi:hypothetical protein